MEKLNTYAQYTEVLAAFKKDKARCSTNTLMTRDELTAWIAAGRLYYAETDGVLWFFIDQGHFYSANFYVPSDTPIRMQKQDMDVVAVLIGSQTRYNARWEQELIAAGFEKSNKRLELACRLDDAGVMDFIQKQLKTLRAVWGSRGFTHRKAVKADYPEICKLWEAKSEKDWYSLGLSGMTDAELEDMERFGRASVICDPEGNICAASTYKKRNKTSHGAIAATYYMGLGAWATYEKYLSAYQEGCVKNVTWIREDNKKSIGLSSRALKPTGTFCWQFICKTR